MEYATLNNGQKLPLLGLGTWQANDDSVALAVRKALDLGYRLIDTAALYGNEKIIGNVLKEYIDSGKVKREDLFITTKLPFTAHKPELVEKCVNESLKRLQLDYIDLYLIHCPSSFEEEPGKLVTPKVVNNKYVPVVVPHLDTWRVLEKLHKAGKLRTLGVSNFNVRQLNDLYEKAEIKPANIQVECHLLFPQNDLLEYTRTHNMTFTAYSPIGSPGSSMIAASARGPECDPFKNANVVELSKKYNKTPAQIILRFLTQKGISAIPKSVNEERLAQNFNIFDFSLTPEEVARLNVVPKEVRLFHFDFSAEHPYYSFDDIDKTKLIAKAH